MFDLSSDSDSDLDSDSDRFFCQLLCPEFVERVRELRGVGPVVQQVLGLRTWRGSYFNVCREVLQLSSTILAESWENEESLQFTICCCCCCRRRLECQKKKNNFGLYMDFYFFSHVYRRACAGLLRCGKSCRLRWTNYLRPDIKRGRFSLEEEQMIIHLHAILGNR